MTEISIEQVTYDAVQATENAVYWIEGRPDGRDALVRWTRESGAQDVLPDGPSVLSLVHEYGGGAYLASDRKIWLSSATDQRLYQASGTGPLTPITPAGPARYADMRADPRGRGLWAVRERHQPDTIINDLVWIPTKGQQPPRTAASGCDFYSFPRPSPDGRWLAWTSWNAPLMPWDGTSLWIAEITNDQGSLGEPTLIAGGEQESVFQPEWSPRGVLHFVSDRSGSWNLFTWQQGHIKALLETDQELGTAQWEHGYSTYAFLPRDRIAVAAQQGGQHTLQVLSADKTTQLELPYTSIKPYISAAGPQIAFIGSSPTRAPEVALANTDTDALHRLTPEHTTPEVKPPKPFSFPTRDNEQAHGLYHPPHGTDTAPLIIKAHPGPTFNTPMRLNWHTEFFTSRGYAVAEIDYRGSTGYGRAYRQALRGRWGLLDAYDCADAAHHLINLGLAAPDRTVIWGASAGGYTALRSMILTDTFAAAIAHCPVVDPATWRDTAPKFQAHHAEGLIGPWPQTSETYRQRSVLEHPEQITRPVLILHGDKDPITPHDQSRALAQRLAPPSRLVTFPNEGHTLRSPKAIQRALREELAFLNSLTTR